MISPITIPQIFENMEEATIGVWLKNEGDAVSAGEALCELITEKTTFELESESAGVLRKIVAPAAAIVPVGALVAWVGDEDETIPESNEQAETPESVSTLKIPSINLSVPTMNVPQSAGASRVRATPAARRAAKDRGISIEDVAAKFPGKVIGEDDVRAF